MKTIVFLSVIFLITGVRIACSNDSDRADLVFIHGNIITMNDALPHAEAAVIKNGKFIYVGNSKKAMMLADDFSEVINLHGRTVIPGIHDVHIHALEAGSEVGGNCWLKANSLKGLKHQLLACLKKQQGIDWLLAYGHELETLLQESEDPRGCWTAGSMIALWQ